MKWCRFLVFVAVLIPSQVLGVPVGQQLPSGPSPVCRRAVSPANSSRGINRVAPDNWDPLFKLDLSESSHHEYRVSVQLGSRFLPFSDAFISAETNGSCGVGELIYDSHDFFRVEQEHEDCPFLLTTNRKSVMRRLPPLRWKAPKCGCVHFRAMVLEASTIYYAEQAGVPSGPLATTVCVGHSGHHNHHYSEKKLSLDERTELLCRATERFSGLEVHQRPEFLRKRRLEPRYIDTQILELALAARRHDIRLCCAKKSQEDKRECFSDVRRRRVDGFCENGSPDVPFAVSKSRFMRQREAACCWRLGESRYDCFSENAATSHGAYSADYSLDETDPLNDLSDHPQEIQDLEKEYGMTLFPWDKTESSKTSEHTTMTTTTTTTTTPSPLLSIPVAWPARASSAASARRTGGVHSGQLRGGWSREEAAMKSSVEAVGEGSLGAVGGVSHEIFEEQQGASSIERTFSKLQKRMWRLALKTQCCEAGVISARTNYGDFGAVWAQCDHGAGKHVHAQGLRRGSKICTTQFQRCCLEVAISSPSEVVTWKPETASSTEWDRDRHLVNKLYFPPYARASSLLPEAKSARRQSDTHSSGQRGASAAALTIPSGVDEPEIDEKPQEETHANKKRHRKQNSASAKRLDRKLSLREEEVEEDFEEEDADIFDERETAVGRHQRRMKKLNVQRRFEADGRRRATIDLDLVDDPEIDGEEPTTMTKRRKKVTRSRSGGVSGRRREMKGRQRKQRRRQLNRLRSKSAEWLPESTTAERTSAGLARQRSNTESLGSKTSVEAERRRRLEAEQEGLRELFALIAKDVDEVTEETVETKEDEPVDDASDLEGKESATSEGDDFADTNVDENTATEEDDGNEENVDDRDTSLSNDNASNNKVTSKQKVEESKTSVQQTAQAQTNSGSTSSTKTTTQGSPKRKETERAPRQNNGQVAASSGSVSSRHRLLRARMRDTSAEYHHSGGRSTRRSRHHKRRDHAGRRKHDRKSRPGQRRRNMPTSRELSEGLEEI